jgi:cytochrome c peroxidase
MKLKVLLSLTIIASIFTAARQITIADYLNLPETAYNYAITLPAYFTTNAAGGPPSSIIGLDNTPLTNPMTNDGATLGRVLFYDKNLSLNLTTSCASCHQQAKGFSDNNVHSIGFLGGTTRRHSMTLIDAKYYQRGRFFWDERAATLEAQVLQPLQDATEMGLTLTQITERVSGQIYYNQLFINAFGTNTVTTDRVSKALAQFVRSIESYQSKYDVGRALAASPVANFSNFTAQENQGKTLFFQAIPNGGGGCAGCHTTEAFVGANNSPQNNGLDATSTTDLGAGEVFTPIANFTGRFKTSTLRNIELTAPYMHDGRFTTLDQVVEHYNSGIQNHPTLANALKNPNGTPIRLNFTTVQKAALVAFMKTLTDNTIATEPRWSNPFSPCNATLSVSGTVTNGTYKSSNTISIQNGVSQTSSSINIDAKNSVDFSPPFEVKGGNSFKVQMGGCN